MFSVILFGQEIRLFDLEFLSVARRLLMKRLSSLIITPVGPNRPFIQRVLRPRKMSILLSVGIDHWCVFFGGLHSF